MLKGGGSITRHGEFSFSRSQSEGRDIETEQCTRMYRVSLPHIFFVAMQFSRDQDGVFYPTWRMLCFSWSGNTVILTGR